MKSVLFFAMITIVAIMFAFTGCKEERQGATDIAPTATSMTSVHATPSTSVQAMPSHVTKHFDCAPGMSCTKSEEGQSCYDTASARTYVCYQCMVIEVAAVGRFTNPDCR